MATKTITANGIDQEALVAFLSNVITIANELKADFNLLRANYLTGAKGAAGLAEGTNSATLKTANILHFSIAGIPYAKAATDNIAMTAAAQQAKSTYCLYLVSVATNGAITVTKGDEVATDTAVLPATPANQAAIGWVKVATNGSTTFTSGTTDLSAAGITASFSDLLNNNIAAEASTAIAATDLSLTLTV